MLWRTGTQSNSGGMLFGIGFAQKNTDRCRKMKKAASNDDTQLERRVGRMTMGREGKEEEVKVKDERWRGYVKTGRMVT